MDSEMRIFIRDILNDFYKEKEILNKVELEQCPLCGSYELEEDMVYHKWDVAQDEEQICETCKGDE